MPDVIPCPYCQREVSANAINCNRCGTEINQVPRSVTVNVLNSLRDVDLPDFLFWYAAKVLEEHGCHKLYGPRDAEVLAKLPRGIRIGYTLVVLSSEVDNGGFHQWFTNSSGMIMYETLEDLRLIGATRHVRLVEEAIRVWKRLEDLHPWCKPQFPDPEVPAAEVDAYWADMKASFRDEFDRLSNEYYLLSEEVDAPDSMWVCLPKYIRENTDETVHQRG
jgi:hypothetical protein